MNWTMVLFFLCSVAGVVMVTGSLFLLWHRKINLNAVEGTISELTLPIGFKIGTQTPVLIMFVLGVFLLTFPVYSAKTGSPEMVRLKAPISSTVPVNVYAVIAQQDKVVSDVILNVPAVKGPYRIMYIYENGPLQFMDPFEWNGNASQQLAPIKVQPPPAPTMQVAKGPRVDPVKAGEFKQEEAIQP